MTHARLARRIVRGFGILAMAGVFMVLLLVVALSLERRTEFTLAAPTGSFAVGRTTFAWVDAATVDTLSPIPGRPRELLIWMWYPATGAAAPSVAMNDYLPAQMRAAAGPPGGVLSFLTRDASKVHGRSTDNAEMSPQQRSYPVAILRGGASAGVVNYTTLAEDLASHGYLVVGIDAPYRTNVVVFPDGRVMRRTPENNPELCVGKTEQVPCLNRLLTAWTGDIGFVLDRLEQLNVSDPSGQLTGRINMGRVGVFGHSFGGSQAAQFCHDDPRCKAGIDIDGIPLGSVIHEGLHQPFMFIFSAQIHASDPGSRRVQADVQSIYDRLPAGRLRVSIRGSTHFTFSDDGALLKSRLVRGGLRMFGQLRIDGPRQLAVTAYCVRSFFDAHLKNATASPLQIASTSYPEIDILE